jgi:bacterial/archaeal transporter family protein
MNGWFGYAIGAAILYGLHQVFTKLASAGASDGLGGFLVEATAAATIGLYLAYLRFAGPWNQHINTAGVIYSITTGICVGAGTVLFFLLFQAGGPLSAVPGVLAVGAAIMVAAGVVVFHETFSWERALGVALSIVAILLLRRG